MKNLKVPPFTLFALSFKVTLSRLVVTATSPTPLAGLDLLSLLLS